MMNEQENFSYPVEEENEPIHPLFTWERFIFKGLSAAALVLVSAIIFQHPSPKLDEGREWLRNSMEKEFQFSKAAHMYENVFGQPLPFTAADWNGKEQEQQGEPVYALPASGKIIQDFKSNGKGIMVETGADQVVSAVKQGTVIFSGQKEEIGHTVVLQHPDGSESWYGHLDSTDVQLYDQVNAGSPIAKAKQGESGQGGEFYLAIRQNETFIDPIQVIPIE